MTIDSNLKQRLEQFAGENPVVGSKEEFAGELAKALSRRDQSPYWASLPFGEQFDRRPWSSSDETNKGVRILRALMPALYLLPIGFTWYHLAGVVAAYKTFTQSQEGQFNLVTFWAGGYAGSGKFTGMTLPTVALYLVFGLLIIGFAQAFVNWNEERSHASEATLNQLITDLYISSARLRAISPEQLTTTFGNATSELKKTINSIESALEKSEGLITAATNSVAVLNQAAAALSTATTGLADVSRPLANVTSELREVSPAISAARNSLDVTARNLEKLSLEIDPGATNRINDIAAVMRGLDKSIRDLVGMTEQSLASASHAATILGAFSDRIESDKPYTDVLLDIAQSFKNTAAGIGETVNQIKTAAELFAQENERTIEQVFRSSRPDRG